ncbi:MAG: outer membrane protein assembly factor BamB family protein, partial [Planctomycetota bacterium]
MNRVHLLAPLLLLLTLPLSAAPKPKPPIRVAVLDLQAPTTSPWLGPAVAEAVAAKLAGVKGVTLVEREKVETIVVAAKGGEVTPKLLGVDAILTGAVQVVGAFGDKAKVRISVKVVAVASAKLKGNAAFVLDGTGAELFALESKLATRFCQALGREATALQLDYREEQNFKAKQHFAEGISLLVKGDHRNAIAQFRAAQKANEGAFYARAHSYEGRAREALATAQKDDAAAKAIRAETVAQFRKDAATAAPAFYDLGRALQANQQPQEAIDAYGEYLKWADSSRKVVKWTRKQACYRVKTTRYPGVRSPKLIRAYCVIDEKRFYVTEKRKLYAYSLEDGELLWSWEADQALGTTWTDDDKALVSVRDRVLFSFRNRFWLIDATTGKEISSVVTAVNGGSTHKDMKSNSSTETAHLYGTVPNRAVVIRHLMDNKKKVMSGLDFATGKVAWEREIYSYQGSGAEAVLAVLEKPIRRVRLDILTGEEGGRIKAPSRSPEYAFTSEADSGDSFFLCRKIRAQPLFQRKSREASP